MRERMRDKMEERIREEDMLRKNERERSRGTFGKCDEEG